jgi:hypothetical protein
VRAPFLIQLLPEFLELVFVLARVTEITLIAAQDPPGGQALQIRASVPIGAAEIDRQISKPRHIDYSGGSCSKRQLVSDSR